MGRKTSINAKKKKKHNGISLAQKTQKKFKKKHAMKIVFKMQVKINKRCAPFWGMFETFGLYYYTLKSKKRALKKSGKLN